MRPSAGQVPGSGGKEQDAPFANYKGHLWVRVAGSWEMRGEESSQEGGTKTVNGLVVSKGPD